MEEELEYYNSQEGMEKWLSIALGPESSLYQGGITTMIKPRLTSCDFASKSAVISYDVEEWQRNPGGTLHGGMLVTTMDTSFGVLCHYLVGQRIITTVNIATTFLKPVDINSTIDVHVRANSIGKTLVSLTCELRIRQKKGLLAATGSATFMILSRDFERPLP